MNEPKRRFASATTAVGAFGTWMWTRPTAPRHGPQDRYKFLSGEMLRPLTNRNASVSLCLPASLHGINLAFFFLSCLLFFGTNSILVRRSPPL
jgi:hypothetical protein